MALAAGAVMPAAGIILQLITRRRLDGVGGIVMATVVAAIVLSVITSSPPFLLAKDGLITAVWGLWFLASTRTRRPAAFVMARRPFMEGRRTFSAGSWEDLWRDDPVFRHIWRVATVMWGVGLLGDAVLRVVMSYTLPIPVVPGLGGALWPVTFVVLQVVSNVYYHRAGLYRILGASSIRPAQVRSAREESSAGPGQTRP